MQKQRLQQVALVSVHGLRCIAQIFDGCLVADFSEPTDQGRKELVCELTRQVVVLTGLSSPSASVCFTLKALETEDVAREFPLDEFDDLLGLDEQHVHTFNARYCLEGTASPNGLNIERDLLPYQDWHLKAFCNSGKTFMVTETIKVLQACMAHQTSNSQKFSALFVASRKAMTAQIVQQFADAKMLIRPYLALKGKLDVGKHPITVWQVRWMSPPLSSILHMPRCSFIHSSPFSL